MPTYYFYVHQADGRVEDDTVGANFPDDEHALQEAERAIGDMATDAARDPTSLEIRITVSEQDGREVGSRGASFEFHDNEG